jgi:DsbC/DsbD-like thiol-disulfide interchange protein
MIKTAYSHKRKPIESYKNLSINTYQPHPNHKPNKKRIVKTSHTNLRLPQRKFPNHKIRKAQKKSIRQLKVIKKYLTENKETFAKYQKTLFSKSVRNSDMRNYQKIFYNFNFR